MIVGNDFSGKFERDLARVCARSPYGARIFSYFQEYHGKNHSFLNFWLQRDDDGIAVCAFCRYYSTMTICAAHIIIDEVQEFLRMLSPEVVFCDGNLGLDIYSAYKAGEVMRCTKLLPNKRAADVSVRKLNSDMRTLKGVYTLLARDNSSGRVVPEFGEYYLNVSHCIRYGAADVYAVYGEDGEVISTAAVTAKSADSAVIGGVATDERYRRQGLASAVVTAATEDILSAGRAAYLYREKRIRLYESIGYRVCGEWRELYMKTT